MKKNTMRKMTILILLLFLLISTYAEEVNKIIAKVNNQVITLRDLADYRNLLAYRSLPQSKDESFNEQEAVEKLIEDRLILDQARKENFEVPNAWINERVNHILSSYDSPEAFENSLVERGLTMTTLRERIKEQYLVRQVIQKYVESYISISPQEISSFYQRHKDEFLETPQYTLWIAKATDQSSLESISAVVKEKGIKEAAKELGRSLVKIESTLEELKEELASVLTEMKEGEQIMKEIGELYYFIYLEKVTEGRTLSAEEAKGKIHALLWKDKFQNRFSVWIKELKDKAVIKVYD